MGWVKIFKAFEVKRKDEPNLTEFSREVQLKDFQKKYIDRTKYNYAEKDFFMAMRNAKDISMIDLLSLFKFNLELFRNFKRSLRESDFYKG